ncbi:MAG: dienelactone hydrolase family protein [Thiotrichales bacterium]|nr:dienelactone hydrolase family protein [Thiotrichales bacterium]
MSAAALETLDSPVVVEPSRPATAAVVWLHGLGADGHDFEPVAAEIARGGLDDVRYVFPHAPVRPVTINGGMAMRAWYDITGPELDRRADEEGGRESAGIARALVDEQIARGIAGERIVLAGFSQGGAIALHAGLRFPFRVAGILALSTYLPAAKSLAAEAHPSNRDVPIFLAHGSQDPVVALALSERSRAAMADLGYVVEVHTYPMPHSVCAEEVRDIANWLQRVLAQG